MRKPLSSLCALGIPLAFTLLATGMLSCSDSGEMSETAVTAVAPKSARGPRGSTIDAPRQGVSTTEALLAAATRGDTETVKLLLEAGMRTGVRDNNDATPLILAAREGHSKIVALLLSANAKVDATDRYGTTALMAATGAGHLDVVRALIAAGADLSLQDDKGWTALMWAETNGHAQIEELLAPTGLSPENARVAQLQRFLNVLGYNPGPVDGLYGPQTADAVRDYQRQAQLPVTGMINEDLLEHARQALKERRLARGQAGQGG